MVLMLKLSHNTMIIEGYYLILVHTAENEGS